MDQLTKAQALKLIESRFWETMTYRQRAEFQLFTERLCMPFDVFQKAVEKALERPVFTHELAIDLEGIQAEILGQREAPTLAEVLDLIPADRRIVILTDG